MPITGQWPHERRRLGPAIRRVDEQYVVAAGFGATTDAHTDLQQWITDRLLRGDAQMRPARTLLDRQASVPQGRQVALTRRREAETLRQHPSPVAGSAHYLDHRLEARTERREHGHLAQSGGLCGARRPDEQRREYGSHRKSTKIGNSGEHRGRVWRV
ncbi:MAG: hypothetical protein AW12_01694 [Candidatus Accumulibacter sp. BA-94]|nr:MAG: hypothetical protein AW12_01694 [Candidatus Accumulibacter sp. BA-94]